MPRWVISSLTLCLFLTAIILVSPVSAVDASNVITIDDLEFGGFIDASDVSIWDNSTHLLINVTFDGSLPIDSQSIKYEHWIQVDIDLDNNFLTGRDDYFSYGRDIILFFVFSSTVKYGFVVNKSFYFHSMPTDWFTYTSSSFSAAVPLNDLLAYNNYIGVLGTRFRILRIMLSTGIYDWFVYEGYTNSTDLSLNKRDISVDGDPSDWLGASPTIIDQGDGTNHYYQEFNATALYTALSTDGSVIYHLINLSAIFDPSKYLNFPHYTNWYYDYRIEIRYDTDNDGLVDIYVNLNPYYCWVSNKTGVSVEYQSYTSNFNISLSGKWIEIGYPSSYPSVYQIPAGTVKIGAYIDWSYRDYAPKSRDIIPYSIGKGGYISHFIEPVDTNVDWVYGSQYLYPSIPYLLYVDDFSVNFSVSSPMRMVMRGYDKDLSGVNEGIKTVSNFYVLWFSIPEQVDWPIKINITYSDAAIKNIGMGEAELKPFYFNIAKGRYVPFKNYAIDTINNIVYITMDMDEYLNSDGIIVLGYESKLVKHYTFIGVSQDGIGLLTIDLAQREGKLSIYQPIYNMMMSYPLRFTDSVDTGGTIILNGYIKIRVLDRAVWLPTTVVIDKLSNKAYVIGPIPFVSLPAR